MPIARHSSGSACFYFVIKHVGSGIICKDLIINWVDMPLDERDEAEDQLSQFT